MDVFPKFIIETDDELGDVLIIAKCTYHKELTTNKEKVKGGGWFKFNKETNTFILSDESYDFGRAKIEDIKNCIDKGNVYTNSRCYRSIADKYSFDYKNEVGEIINLKSL
jgi:hypothetical protein